MNDPRCSFVVYIVFKAGKEGDMGGGSEGGGGSMKRLSFIEVTRIFVYYCYFLGNVTV